MLEKLKRNSPTILTFVGAIGVVATAVTAVKATPKVIKILEEATDDKGEELTKTEIVKLATPAYIPSTLIGVSTIICIFGANSLNKRTQASLISAYALLDRSYKEYKNKVGEIYGEDADFLIKKSITKDKYKESEKKPISDDNLFFDYFSLSYFESTIEKVKEAEYIINETINSTGFASLSYFYDLVGVNDIDTGYKLGWYKGMFNGRPSIGLKYETTTIEDGSPDGLECCIISMDIEPTTDYL